MKQHLPFLLLTPFLTLTAHAAEITLPEALDLASAQSPGLQRAASVESETRWRKVEAFSTYLPSLTLGGTYLAAKKYLVTDVVIGNSPAPVGIPAIVPTTSATLTAQYPLFEGFAGTLRYGAAKAEERAATNELTWAKFETSRQVALQFYRSLASETLKDVADQNVKLLEDHLREVSAFKKAGVSTNYDVLQVDVQVTEARSEAMNALDNVTISKGRLAELLGETEARDPKGKLPELSPELIKNVALDSGRSRPDLVALGDRVQALETSATASSRHWVPRLNLFATYNYYNNRNDSLTDFERFRNAYQAGVTLNWNIFDGFTSTARSKQAEERHVQLETSLRATQLKAHTDFDVWKRKYLYNLSVYRSRLGNIDKAKEAVRLAREGRKAGVRTSFDLLNAETDLYRAQAGAINAQLGSIEALVNLELATGQTLLPL
ncbi:MAG: TolC family protein [Proteobacteria bacterium]|nr:MAG: TolC family protein [Pseudomonadota bacterium]